MATHKIEKDILKAIPAFETQGDDEPRADYLERLVRAAGGVDDETWESLQEGTHEWVNAGAQALKDKKPIADFDGKAPKAAKAAKAAPAPAKGKGKGKAAAEQEPEEETEEEVEEQEEVEEVEETKPRKGAKGANGKAAAKPRPRAGGMAPAMFVRHHLAANPTDSVDEIVAAMDKAGQGPLSRMTVQSLRNEFRTICRVLREKDVFKRGIELGNA